jgi:ribose/xylose/arabinose/galactoside ABC-type transport system permease subunit
VSSRVLLRAFAPALGLVATWVLFAVLAGASFTSWSNQQLMLLQTAVVGTAAVGATWIIVAGGIDLSVGSTIALGTMVIALLLRSGWGAWPASLAGVASGALVGALIGALVVGHLARVVPLVLAVVLGGWISRSWSPMLGIAAGVVLAALGFLVRRKFARSIELSPFIVTLGLWGALRGLAKGLGDNQPIYADTEGSMRAMESLRGLMNVGGSGLFAVLPPGVWILVVAAVLASLAMRFTVFGRHVFAVGSNEETARLCGIDVERTKWLVYVIGVACAGVASVLQLSYLSMGDPTTAQGYELKVIAAVVIGGASLSGGQGSVAGTLVGALIMTVVDNGCTKLGLDNWVQEIVTGAIIVAAVALDRWRQRESERS